ncbi:MAG: hypothetical protein ACQES5_02955 [Thermodesulfobacteriota bacterium]
MVNLGFVRGIDLSELCIPRVHFVREQPGREPVLYSWPQQDKQLWELRTAMCSSWNWPGDLAGCLRKMHWTKWAVDTSSIISNSNADPEQTLESWGEEFWPQYREDAVVYLLVHENEPICRKIAGLWARNYTHVCLRQRYDLINARKDAHKCPQPTGRLSRLKRKIMRAG